MNQKTINKISKTVYKQFPEFRGNNPRVKQEPLPKSMQPISNYVLTYHTVTVDEIGRKFRRQVRVVADQKGEIMRISTSR